MEKLATENPELVEKSDIDVADCYKYATLSRTPIETKKTSWKGCAMLKEQVVPDIASQGNSKGKFKDM